jgi:limonene-1,2-epoxide hydrolase
MGSDSAGGEGRPEQFTAETARQMFSFRGKNPSGEGVDMSIVREHYHPDVRFQDAIQVIQGKDAVIEMMLRFPKRVAELSCTVHEAAQKGDVIFVEWSMDMRARKSLPVMTNHGVSKLRLDEEGLVIEQRDYFDLWGDMIDAFPRVSKVYRAIVRHME